MNPKYYVTFIFYFDYTCQISPSNGPFNYLHYNGDRTSWELIGCTATIPKTLWCCVKQKWKLNAIINKLTVSQQWFYIVFLSRCSHILFHKVVNLAPSLLVNGGTFWGCSIYTQSWYYHLLPINLFTCEMSKQCHSLPAPYLLPSSAHQLRQYASHLSHACLFSHRSTHLRLVIISAILQLLPHTHFSPDCS